MATETIATLDWSFSSRTQKTSNISLKNMSAPTVSHFCLLMLFLLLSPSSPLLLISLAPHFSSSPPSLCFAYFLISVHLSPFLLVSQEPLIHPSMSPCLLCLHQSVHLSHHLSSPFSFLPALAEMCLVIFECLRFCYLV